jgi:hypothetical protein
VACGETFQNPWMDNLDPGKGQAMSVRASPCESPRFLSETQNTPIRLHGNIIEFRAIMQEKTGGRSAFGIPTPETGKRNITDDVPVDYQERLFFEKIENIPDAPARAQEYGLDSNLHGDRPALPSDCFRQWLMEMIGVDHNRFKPGVVKAPHPKVKDGSPGDGHQDFGANQG